MSRQSPVRLVVVTAAVLAWATARAAAPAATEPTPATSSPTAAAEDDPRSAEGVAFLVLPITSDEEGLGEQVRQMLRAKAKRLGAVVYDPSSVAETLGAEKVSADTPPAKLAALGRERFKADLVVTGEVKGKGPYEVRLLAVHTDDPRDPHAATRTYICAYHQVIPLEMAKAVYDILGLTQPKDPLRMLREDPEVERRWREGPNLVRNPGFEQADASGKGPADWQALEDQMAWVTDPDGRGKVLKFEMNQATADSYGLDFYSDWIPIEPGATYRFSCRYKTLGPTPKIFLKGYHAFEASSGYAAQRRETYRRQVHPTGEKGKWNTVTADFIPESLRPEQTPTFLKVDLYAYHPAGVISWDDIVLKKVRDAAARPAGAAPRSDAAAPAKGSP